MSRRFDERKLLTRRAFMIASGQALLGAIVISRLSYLQIFRSKHYKLLSEKNRIVTKLLLPERGKILDCNGNVIAKNIDTFSAVLDLTEVDDLNVVLNKIKEHIVVNDDILFINKRKQKLLLLKENLNWEELSVLETLSSYLSGLSIERTLVRKYIDSEAISHIIGYVGKPTKYDFDTTKNMAFLMPTAQIGKCNIEKKYEYKLFGRSGIRHYEVNARRQIVREIDETKSTPGEDLPLTIDMDLQNFVYKRMSEHESGACVVMNVHTGAILAFVSYPGYDTNLFTKKIDRTTLHELYQNPYKPIINKAISGLYAPGSTFKMITGLAGLKKGIIDENTNFSCNGVFKIGSYKYHCWRWKYGGHGYVDLEDAIAESCDTFFYNVAMRLSADDITDVAKDFGLGLPTGIDLPNEKSGIMPTNAWKKSMRSISWTKGDTINMSIGQGYTLATVMQLTKMIAMLVNGLQPITPYLCKTKQFFKMSPLKYKEEHMRIILNGMNKCVNGKTGTARSSKSLKMPFGGKTGSSQVCRITAQQRKEFKTVSDDYWKKEHALFTGYAPVDSPEYAICVLVEHGGGGATKAAPIARDIFEYIKSRSDLQVV